MKMRQRSITNSMSNPLHPLVVLLDSSSDGLMNKQRHSTLSIPMVLSTAKLMVIELMLFIRSIMPFKALLFPFLCFVLFSPADAVPFAWNQYTVRSGQIGPSGRKFHAFGFDNSRQFLVVFGGIGVNGMVLNDTWVLDVAAGRWYEAKTGDHRPEGRYGTVYGMYNGQMIVAGGCDSKYCLDDIWSFHVASFVWTRLQAEGFLRPRPRGHSSGGIFMFGRNLILSGGINIQGEYFSDTFTFDLMHNRWHQIEAWESVYDPSSPHPRAFQASTIINDSTMLTFGGCIKHGACPSAATWTYDWQISKWKQMKPCAMARWHGSMALTSFNNIPYVVLYGGDTKSRQIIASTNTLKDNEIAVFDMTRDEWSVRLTEGTKFPKNRLGAALASTGQAVYLFGGEIGGRFPVDVHVLSGDPSSALATSCGESFFTLISLHGLLMFLGFAILLQFGGGLAQYSTVIREPETLNWRYLHKVIQILGLTFVFCAFICGILIIPDGHYHFQSVHGTLGMLIFLLLLAQGFLGFMSMHYHELRALILTIHFWLGVSILLLAYVNISLGLFLAMSSAPLWITWFVYLLLICGIGCFVLAYDCCKEKRLLTKIISPMADPELDKHENVIQQQLGYIPHAVISYRNGDYMP